MRILHLAFTLALLAPPLLAPGAAAAQSAAEQMLATAKQLRASAEQLKGSLPDKDRAKMIEQAEEIEKGVRNGDYAGAVLPPKEKPLSERLMAQYGRLEWLTPTGACAGYTPENYQTFRFSPGINDRDSHCRNAYGHWGRYLQATRNGEGAEESEKALYYYDAAARRAVTLQGGK